MKNLTEVQWSESFRNRMLERGYSANETEFHYQEFIMFNLPGRVGDPVVEADKYIADIKQWRLIKCAAAGFAVGLAVVWYLATRVW